MALPLLPWARVMWGGVKKEEHRAHTQLRAGGGGVTSRRTSPREDPCSSQVVLPPRKCPIFWVTHRDPRALPPKLPTVKVQQLLL